MRALHYAKKTGFARTGGRTPGRGRRIVSFLLCLCMIVPFLSNFSGWILSSVAEATDYVTDRKSDPNTMDDYLNQLLSTEWGSRYAGRIWTDKSVLAFGQKAGDSWDGRNLTLDMATDGFNGLVGASADFLHIFSALASSQVVHEWPPSPIDMVLVLDISSSMGDDVTPAEGSVYAELKQKLLDFFKSTDGAKYVETVKNHQYYKDNHSVRYDLQKYNESHVAKDYLKVYFYDEALEKAFLAGDKINIKDNEGKIKVEDDGAKTVPNEIQLTAAYYAKPRPEYTKKFWNKPIEEVAADCAFEYTRLLNLIVSADRVIEQLMENNPENRVAVVVYDRRAEVVMPLAHYKANTKKLSDLIQDSDYKNCYDSKDIKEPETTGHREDYFSIFEGIVEEQVFHYICPFFDAHGTSSSHPLNYVDASGFSVVATTDEKEPSDLKDVGGSRVKGHSYVARLSGTNTHAGLTAGLEQLAEATETTYSAKLTSGTTVTVPRIPAAIVMTDGGSNTVANGPWYDPDYATPVQRSDHKNEWSSVVDAQYLLTAAYLKSAVEKNYAQYMALNGGVQDLPVYTVGVDLRDDSDDWVPARLYPMLDPKNYFMPKDDVPEYADNPTDPSGQIELGADSGTDATSNEGIIGAAYELWKAWCENSDTSPTYSFPVSDTDKGWFQQLEESSGKYSNNPYIIPFENDRVNLPSGGLVGGLYGTYNAPWHGWTNSFGETVTPNLGAISGTATFWNFAEAQANGAAYLASRAVTYEDNVSREKITRHVDAVMQDDMISNINYVTQFYNVTSGQVEGIFEQILTAVIGQVFIPISGENEAGVGNSITYQDPLGTYMEIKNQAISTQTHADEEEGKDAGTYDMSLLVFGKMHGLVRAGVYDYQWNNAWMIAHQDGDTIIPDETPFPMGWYKGDPDDPQTPTDLDGDGSGTWPAAYDSAEAAWADGWVYRFNFATLLQFVPIADAPANNLPGGLSPQVKNTVYTCYRFAGTQEERNELHMNPIFGSDDDIPESVLDAWVKDPETHQYPDSDTVYGDVPGVYRLSDIRIWVEELGDFTDTDGVIVPNAGYDRSLYMNIPADAVPTQLATVTLDQNGVQSYETNLGSDHPDGGTMNGKSLTTEEYYAQSTPLRLFYAVGLEENLILRDETTNEQIGVDFTKISPEYIQSHTVTGQDYVWFISNYFSNTTYDDYVTGAAQTSRGDPTMTFSPSVENRYYIFQKPLPLYAHAYRVTADGTTAAVDYQNGHWRGADGKWTSGHENGKGNSDTVWENGRTGGGSWAGGEYMGTYDSEESFQSAVEKMKASADPTHITDDHGSTYLYVEDGIVLFTNDALNHVTSNPDGEGGYADGSISFNSDDYFFILVEYYVPDTDSTVTDDDGNIIKGAHKGRMVQRVVARKGSEFGSGFVSEEINNGDMLCWVSMDQSIDTQFDYLSKTDTGDLTRGEPTFEKLTYDEAKLRQYLQDICGIKPETMMANPAYNPESPESGVDKEICVLDYQVQYWTRIRQNAQIQAALNDADTNHDGQCDADEFRASGLAFAVATKPGGIRSGNMANNVHKKQNNVTGTAENYYVPTVSNDSGIGDGAILNNYMGNNGYLEIANQMLHVTKLLEAPDGYTLSQNAYAEEFNFQVYVQGVSGKRSAILTQYNEFSKSWDRQLAYIDVLTDNSDLVVDNDSNRALFVKSFVEGTMGDTLTAKQVIAQTDEAGNPVYYEANEDGTLPTKDDGSLDGSKIVEINSENPLYYLYLPSNGDSETAKHTRRLYQNGRYDGEADGYAGTNFVQNGTTTFYAEGQRKDTGVEPGVGNNDSYRETNDEEKRPAGTITYWAQDAELIPVSEVQAAETLDNIMSGEPSAYAAETVDATPGVWTHGTENHKDHISLTFFTLVIRRPSDETSMTAFESPFKTRSSYMTVDLVFGQNANEKDGSAATGALGANDLYDTIIPSADRSDLFGDKDGNLTLADGSTLKINNTYIAAHTAEFTLKHGEGLLLSGLDNRIAYRFTEKLTPDQLAKGYTLKQINHIQQRDSDTVYMPGVQKIPVDTNLEPFAHTNAVLWESYATMAEGVSGNHHDVSKNPSCVNAENEASLGVGKCDLQQEDGTVRHYFYHGGQLIDLPYEGDGSSRYVLNPTAHFGTVGETQESTATTPATLPADGYYKYSGVYSVYGNTGWFEEQANYVNTVSPDLLALTKELVDENGNPVTTTAEIPFKFTLDLTPDSSVMTNTDGKLYYWVGSTEDLAKSPEAGGPPLLNEIQNYINEDGTSEKLTVLTPDEGSPNQYTVTFNAGQAVVIYGLITGTEYTVTEVEQDNYPAYQDHYSYSGTIVHLQPVEPGPGVTPYAEIIPNRTVNREDFLNQILTGLLTVEKRIDETDPDGSMEFTFTLTLTEKADATEAEKLNKDKLTVTKYSGDTTTTIPSSEWSEDGTILTLTFTLKHNEKITVEGIPMDTAFEVKEIGRRGYDLKSVVHVNADGSDGEAYDVENDAVNDSVTASTPNPDVRFINVQPPLLPFTGGIGVGGFYLLGFALLLTSGALYAGIRRKRRAGVK